MNKSEIKYVSGGHLSTVLKAIKVKTKNTITSDTQSLLKLIVTLKIITFKLELKKYGLKVILYG